MITKLLYPNPIVIEDLSTIEIPDNEKAIRQSEMTSNIGAERERTAAIPDKRNDVESVIKGTSTHSRKVSLSDIESFVLHKLFVDDHNDHGCGLNASTPQDEMGSSSMREDITVTSTNPAISVEQDDYNPSELSTLSAHQQPDLLQQRVLNDDILFTIPPLLPEESRANRHRHSIAGLWKAREDGMLNPRKRITSRNSSNISDNHSRPCPPQRISSRGTPRTTHRKQPVLEHCFSPGSLHSFDSEAEIRVEKNTQLTEGEAMSTSSSIHEDDHQDYFDAWEVLRDEYAEDFGFSYQYNKGDVTDYDDNDSAASSLAYNTFKILGTSADDKSAQPHVLSPPLMDAIMTFLPDDLHGQNFWLRYSLVRDGADLETMKHYIRSCKYTVLAIETTQGDVFGSFTSAPWRTNYGFFGSVPAFVWKMRHNRFTKCSSLYEQAQLESMIDVFMCTDRFQKIQVCRHNGIAIGGNEKTPDMDAYNYDGDNEVLRQEHRDAAENSGFAFAIDELLVRGMTNRSSVFKSPCLVGPGDASEVFQIAGLEVWTFTPCYDIPSAERLEMTKYFVEESISRNNSSLTSSSISGRSLRTPQNSLRNGSNSEFFFSSQDLDRQSFFRRIGDDPESERRRELWQYQNTYDGTQRSAGSSPKFASSSPRFLKSTEP